MITPGRLTAAAVFAASVAVSLAVRAQDTPARAFVQASRAALRSQPAATAPVVAFLPTNTAVDLRERGREWCRVRTVEGGSDGFVACRLLGASALTIAAIDEALKKPGLSDLEALDWLSKRFWVAPSLQGLVDVGVRMLRLSGRVERPRSREFEDMRRRLDQGIVGTMPRIVGTIPRPGDGVRDVLVAAMKRASLPAVQASFFGAADQLYPIALRPFTVRGSVDFVPSVVDALSAFHQVPFRTRRWQRAYVADYGLRGTWDVGGVEITFDRDVTIRGVADSGAPTGFALSSLVTPLGEHACTSEDSANIRGQALNTAWRSAIVAWIGKAPPPAAAAVNVRQIGGKDKYDKLVIEAVDLDNDGSADFSLWAGLQRAEISTDTFWKAVFVNIGGKWSLLAFNQQADCT
jgi:SH3 domain-containing protein